MFDTESTAEHFLKLRCTQALHPMSRRLLSGMFIFVEPIFFRLECNRVWPSMNLLKKEHTLVLSGELRVEMGSTKSWTVGYHFQADIPISMQVIYNFTSS